MPQDQGYREIEFVTVHGSRFTVFFNEFFTVIRQPLNPEPLSPLIGENDMPWVKIADFIVFGLLTPDLFGLLIDNC